MSNPKINLHHGDCMEAMAKIADNTYDLAIIDPEYGINASNPSKKKTAIKQANGEFLPVKTFENKGSKEWDSKTVDRTVIEEVKRVSKRQIIWGANYIGLSGGRLIWDKLNHGADQYDAEIAYLSWTDEVRMVYYRWQGMIQGKKVSDRAIEAYEQQGNKKLNEKRIHPTQKPVKLYKWLLKHYATKGDRILDTHGGSMSIAIACLEMGFDLDLWELDPVYYSAGLERFKIHVSQPQIQF